MFYPLAFVYLKDFIPGLAALITCAGLITTWVMNHSNTKSKNSETFLNETKSYFDNAVSLLSEKDNNCIKWRNSIHSLEVALEVAKNITLYAHKALFIGRYIDTVYKIANIVNQIDSYKFFFGYPDYQNLSDQELFSKSFKKDCVTYNTENLPSDSEQFKMYRIHPDELSFLCQFLHRANELHPGNARSDTPNNCIKKIDINQFDLWIESITKVSLDEQEQMYLFPLYPKIINYINKYNQQKKSFYQS